MAALIVGRYRLSLPIVGDGAYIEVAVDSSGRVILGAVDSAAPLYVVTNVQVLGAGDNNIGNVDVASISAGTNNIGDVDVLSVVPGTGATALGKAEDAVSASGDTGMMILGIRDDTLDVRSGTEGDYEPFHMTATGRLYTSATVDAALPAGTNSIGTVVDGGSGKTLKRAVLNTSTDNADVIAAVASKRLKIYSYAIQATGTVNVFLRDGSAGGALTPTYNFQAREGVVESVDPPNYLFATTAGNELEVDLSGAVTVGIAISYWDDDAT